MKRYFGRKTAITLRKKLILFLLILASIPVGMISIVSIRQIGWAGNERNRQLLTVATQNMANQLNDAFDNVSNVLDSGIKVESYLFLMDNKGISRMKQYTMNLLLFFEEYAENNPYGDYIEDICIISTDGRAYDMRRGPFALEKDFYSYDMVKTMMENPSEDFVFAPAKPMYSYRTQKDCITFAHLVSYHNQVRGMISIDVSMDLVSAVFGQTQEPYDYSVLINRQGETLVGSHNPQFLDILHENIDAIQSDDDPSGIFPVKMNKQKYYLSYQDCGINGWRVVTLKPSSEIDKPLQSVQSAVLMASLACLIISVFLITFITKRYFKPITNLQTIMSEALKNNFDLDVSYSGDYEIEQLYADFNTLLGQTREYMHRIMVEQENLKVSEMSTLQSQINPHFLYNTLDIAVHVAETKQVDQVINLLLALSRYYRTVLSGGMRNISLEREIENTKTYLYIMKMHYQGMMDYRVTTEGNLALCPSFPKITLQPIVENAILHGLDGSEHGGFVDVHVAVDRQQQLLTIRVSDNGIGMSEEQVHRLMEQPGPDEPNHGNSFGLSNIRKRLDIFFKGDYIFQVESKLYHGTTITIQARLNLNPPEEV